MSLPWPDWTTEEWEKKLAEQAARRQAALSSRTRLSIDLGGPGSGHHGHAGVKGEGPGGSAPGKGGGSHADKPSVKGKNIHRVTDAADDTVVALVLGDKFESEAVVRDLAESMVQYADQEQYTISIGTEGSEDDDPEDRAVVLEFTGDKGTSITRVFRKDRHGNLVAHHDYFRTSVKGGGIAKDIMRASFDEYERLGIEKVKVHANIDVGGYAWAKFGFKTTGFPDVDYWIDTAHESGKITDDEKRTLQDIATKYDGDDTLLWHIADAKSPRLDDEGQPVKIGAAVLIDSDWNGEINLSDKEAMGRLRRYIAETKPKKKQDPSLTPEALAKSSERADRAISRDSDRAAAARRQEDKAEARIAAKRRAARAAIARIKSTGTGARWPSMPSQLAADPPGGSTEMFYVDDEGTKGDRELWRVLLGEDFPEAPSKALSYRERLPFLLGGPGSGHHGHEGVEGQKGGSAPGKGGGSKDTKGTKGIAFRKVPQRADLPDTFDPSNVVEIGEKKDGGTVRIRDTRVTDAQFQSVFGDQAASTVLGQMVEDLPGNLVVAWHPRTRGVEGETSVTMAVRGDGLSFDRTFTRHPDGTLTVHHDLFQIPKEINGEKAQGKGIAKAVMADSLHTYRQLGVDKIETLANRDVGGYAWAKFGFKMVVGAESGSVGERSLADQLTGRLEPSGRSGTSIIDQYSYDERGMLHLDPFKTPLTAPQRQGLLDLIETHKDDPTLPWHVAGTKLADGREIGKELLREAYWPAELDLHDKESVDRLEHYIEGH